MNILVISVTIAELPIIHPNTKPGTLHILISIHNIFNCIWYLEEQNAQYIHTLFEQKHWHHGCRQFTLVSTYIYNSLSCRNFGWGISVTMEMCQLWINAVIKAVCNDESFRAEYRNWPSKDSIWFKYNHKRPQNCRKTYEYFSFVSYTEVPVLASGRCQNFSSGYQQRQWNRFISLHVMSFKPKPTVHMWNIFILHTTLRHHLCLWSKYR